MEARIDAADKRAIKLSRAGGWFDVIRRVRCEDASDAWDDPGSTVGWGNAEKNRFQSETLLDRQEFIDIACFAPIGNATPIGEGKNAFMTESIFADQTLKNWLMNLYRSVDEFNYISRVFIRNNLRKVLASQELADHFINKEPQTLGDKKNEKYLLEQRRIEEELSMRTARIHNGGTGAFSTEITDLTRACGKQRPCDWGGYVGSFIGINPGRGDWRSLRCFSSESLRGVEMIPLRI
jgi:hypothetical protein